MLLNADTSKPRFMICIIVTAVSFYTIIVLVFSMLHKVTPINVAVAQAVKPQRKCFITEI